jgi:hypothetical protein
MAAISAIFLLEILMIFLGIFQADGVQENISMTATSLQGATNVCDVYDLCLGAPGAPLSCGNVQKR